MRTRRAIAPILTAAALLLLNSACSLTPSREFNAKPSRFEIHHYFTRPADQQIFELSPDGTQLAALSKTGRHANITVTNLETGERENATNFGAISVTGFTWANNRRLLLYGPWELAILSVNADGGMGRVLADMKQICAEACDEKGERLYFLDYVQAIDPLIDDPDNILVAKNSLGALVFLPEAYRMNVVSGDLVQVDEGPGRAFIDRWFTDTQGHIIGGELEGKDARAVLLVNRETGAWEELYRGSQDQLSFTPVAVTPDQRGYALTNRAADGSPMPHTGLYHFDFAARALGEPVLVTPGADCCDIFVSPHSGRLISASYSDETGEKTVYLDAAFRQHMDTLAGRIPARDLRITSLDAAANKAVIMATTGTNGRDYYLYDFKRHSLELLAGSPDIVELVSAEREATRYEVVMNPSRRGFAGGGQADMPKSTVPKRPVNVGETASRRPVGSGQ